MTFINKFRKAQSQDIDGILKQLQADFTAVKRKIAYEGANGEWVPWEGKYTAIVKEGNDTHKEYPFAVMGSDYGLVQYQETLKFLNKFTTDKEIEVTHAALTEGGARLHLLCKTNYKADLDNGDDVTCYFTISTSHDGSYSLTLACTPIHSGTGSVFSPMGKGIIKLKHSKHVIHNMANLKAAMEKVNKFFTEFVADLRKMRGITIDDDEAKVYVGMLFKGDHTRARRTRAKVMDIYKTGDVSKIPSCNGTLFGLLIAVQHYADSYQIVRKSKARNQIDAEIESKLSGTAAKTKALAYATFLKLQRMEGYSSM